MILKVLVKDIHVVFSQIRNLSGSGSNTGSFWVML